MLKKLCTSMQDDVGVKYDLMFSGSSCNGKHEIRHAGAALSLAVLATGCTQETQNKLGRAIKTGPAPMACSICMRVKTAMRVHQYRQVDHATTTGGGEARVYRYGYGVLDLNQNFVADPVKKIYFEVSDYSTNPYFMKIRTELMG